MSDTLIDTITRATQDPAERLLLALRILDEVREESKTETGTGCGTTYRFQMVRALQLLEKADDPREA